MQRADQLSNEHTTPVLLSINDVARRWSISRGTVNSLIHGTVNSEGRLRSVTLGSRRLIPLAEINRYEQKLLDDAQATQIR